MSVGEDHVPVRVEGKQLHTVNTISNLRIVDTLWTSHFDLCREVVLFQRIFCTE